MLEHRRYGIGVMGCARIADRSMLREINSNSRLDLIAIASRDQQKAAQFALKYGCTPVQGYDHLLEMQDIEIIYMPLPTGLHKEWISKCLDADKHVLVEKTFASDWAAADLLVEKAKERNLLLVENFMFLQHRQHAFVDELIRKGSLGEIRVVEAAFAFPPLQKDDFRYVRTLGGGALNDAGCYPIRVSNRFLANLKVGWSFQGFDSDSEVEIFGHVTLHNQEGQVATVSYGFDNYYQCRYSIWGNEGKATVCRAFTPPIDQKTKIVIESKTICEDVYIPADNQVSNTLSEFVSTLDEGDFTQDWHSILEQASSLEEVRCGATRNV